MPKINVYLPDDLAEAVKEAGVPVTAVCQRALEQAVRRVTAIRETALGDLDGEPRSLSTHSRRSPRPSAGNWSRWVGASHAWKSTSG